MQNHRINLFCENDFHSKSVDVHFKEFESKSGLLEKS